MLLPRLAISRRWIRIPPIQRSVPQYSARRHVQCANFRRRTCTVAHNTTQIRLARTWHSRTFVLPYAAGFNTARFFLHKRTVETNARPSSHGRSSWLLSSVQRDEFRLAADASVHDIRDAGARGIRHCPIHLALPKCTHQRDSCEPCLVVVAAL
jgi:hypothetical protein